MDIGEDRSIFNQVITVVPMPNFSLESIEERLAKAKEEAEFWEKARAVLADPRLKEIAVPAVKDGNGALHVPSDSPMPRVYGELRSSVYAVLPNADAGIADRLTTPKIVARLQEQGYVFQSREPGIAVNGALVALEDKGLAEWSGKRGNAKLWRKKRQKTPEAPEGAS